MDNEMQKVSFASIAEVGLQNGYSPENIIQAMMQQGASRDFATRGYRRRQTLVRERNRATATYSKSIGWQYDEAKFAKDFGYKILVV